MKSRHKITLLFTLLVTTILLGVSLAVFYFTALERQQIFKKRLTSRALNYAQIYSYFSDSSNSVLNRINYTSKDLISRKSVDIFSLTGKPLYRYSIVDGDSVAIDGTIIAEAIENRQYYFKYNGREALAVHYAEEGLGGVVAVVGGYDIDGWTQLSELRQILVFAVLTGLIVTLIVGHVFSKQLLRPVAQIISEVKDISSHNLSRRIHTGATQDELNQLAGTFNDLLDRLEESFTSQRRFISNASHELSTPLTSISSQLQVALQRDRSPEEYRRVMQSVQEDVVQMRELTKSLLEIARTGSEGGIELNDVRIDEILFKVMGDIKKANAGYSVELDFIDSDDNDEYGFLVFGNADLLYIAIKNLVENGCKYSADQVSRVNLSFDNELTIVEVNSVGEPISQEEIERIFQPFYRSTNSAGKSGFGLGLALAKRIVRLHKGNLDVSSSEKSGTSFTITLPTLTQKQ